MWFCMENPSGTGLLNPHKKLLLRLGKAQTGKKKQRCVEFPDAAKLKQLPLPASRLPELIGPARASLSRGYDAKILVSKTGCRRYLPIDIIQTKFPEITSDAACIRGTAIKLSDVRQRLAALGVGRTIEGFHLILPSFPLSHDVCFLLCASVFIFELPPHHRQIIDYDITH